ncbi:MAG: hypothetical protein C0598_00870 [Marinilabiliales bacterium]|nr:MAG: hypothetical protein C0598_00870 [Marinilabiliales bacterium]
MQAGWVISEVSEDNYGNKSYQTTFIQNNVIRFETQSSIAIIDLKSSIITIVFSNHKLYWQGTIDDFKKGTMEVFEQKLQNIVATAEPEQKEIAKELIEKLRSENNPEVDSLSIPNKIEIKFSGNYDSINGFYSKKYNIFISDSLTESIWITDSLKPYQDINLESMISFTEQLKPANTSNSVEGSEKYLNLIKNGLAVKSTKQYGPYGTLTTVVTSVLQTKINPDFFEAPPTYRKAKLIEIMLMDDAKSPTRRLQDDFNNAKNNPLYD